MGSATDTHRHRRAEEIATMLGMSSLQITFTKI